jgi:hypothetical protein
MDLAKLLIACQNAKTPEESLKYREGFEKRLAISLLECIINKTSMKDLYDEFSRELQKNKIEETQKIINALEVIKNIF